MQFITDWACIEAYSCWDVIAEQSPGIWTCCLDIFTGASSPEQHRLRKAKRKLELWIVHTSQITPECVLEEERNSTGSSSRGDSWTFSWVWLLHGQRGDSRLPGCPLDRVPHALPAPEVCRPQMVPLLLPVHNSTSPRSNEPLTVGRSSTVKLPDGTQFITSWLDLWLIEHGHRYQYLYLFIFVYFCFVLTPGYNTLELFRVIAYSKTHFVLFCSALTERWVLFCPLSAADSPLSWLHFWIKPQFSHGLKLKIFVEKNKSKNLLEISENSDVDWCWIMIIHYYHSTLESSTKKIHEDPFHRE